MGNQLNGRDFLYYLNAENFTNLRADLVEYTPSGSLLSTDVQAALDEIDSLSLYPTNIVANEEPAGLVNGSNATFTAAHNFDPDSVWVTVNGLVQQRTADYSTVGSDQIEFTVSPEVGDIIRLFYVRV